MDKKGVDTIEEKFVLLKNLLVYFFSVGEFLSATLNQQKGKNFKNKLKLFSSKPF
jgi:hypothetical protein